jgi:ankyrin repeat protein
LVINYLPNFATSSDKGDIEIALLLLKHGAEVNRGDKFGGETPFHRAIRRGQLKLARILLEHGAHADVESNDGMTPLRILSETRIDNEGDALRLALLLLRRGAAVNKRDRYIETPLHLAMRRGWFKLVGLLLEHHADVNAENIYSMTPLHMLPGSQIDNEDNVLKIALLLLKHGAEVKKPDRHNQTPLHLAIRRGWLKLAELLLENGADVNVENNDGMTPLHILSESRINDERNVLNHALLLLKHGAEVNRLGKFNNNLLHLAIRRDRFKLMGILLEHGADANAENNNGMIPLHILLESPNKNEGDVLNHVLLLLNHGADVNRRGKFHQTPLNLAIRRGWFKLAGILLEHGADSNAEDNEVTPLHVLSESEITDGGDALNIGPLLLKHGADVNRRDKDNETPLHFAMRWNQFKLAGILLEHGTDSNAENNDGMTPLHVLLESQITDEGDVLNDVLLLLKHGAEVNRRGRFNDSLLHLAIRRDWFKLAGILLEHGADANAENNEVMTPLHILTESGFKDEGNALNLVLLLLKHGTDVNRRDKDNETPLHLAIRWNQYKLAGILLEHGAEVHMQNNQGKTPLRILSESWSYDEGDFVNHARFLLEHGLGIKLGEKDKKTSLLLGIGKAKHEFAQFFY